MPSESPSPLTPQQWEARDYRQAAKELDHWAAAEDRKSESADSTEFVAKLGLDESASVVVMNRAHDRVLIPPPARPVLAAFALVDQPFGFRGADVGLLERVASNVRDESDARAVRDLAARLKALLPPMS
jgi:hypothetical protein